MTHIIRIPVFSFGTNLQSSELSKLEEKKELIVISNCYLHYQLCLYDKKNLCLSLQYHEILILLISYEEILENDENFQEIFNLIQFMQVQKVVCLIVNHDHIKKPQWKIPILQHYIEKSQKAFKGNIEPEYKIVLFKNDEDILNHISFLQSSPKSVDWSENQDTIVQIISQNGKELDVILLKGLLIVLDNLYLENQKVQDQRIQVTKIEDTLNFIQQNQGKYIRKITVSDEKAVQGKTFLMNKPFELNQITEHLEIKPLTETQEKYQDFLTNYKKDQYNYILLLNQSYNVQKLEFAPMKYYELQSIFRISLCTNERLIVNKYENVKQINSKAIIINKITQQIVAFCEITETNYTMTVSPQQVLNSEKEMESLYIPLDEEDVLVQVQRGEQVQKGKHITKCRLCMEAEADCLLLPCSHIRYCFQCASEQQECLFCDQKIIQKKKLKMKKLPPSTNSILKNISQSYLTLWRHSVQTYTDLSSASFIENKKSTIDFQDYFCINCKKQKSIFYRICEATHLVGYCDECISQPQKCLKECNKKILFQGKFKYIFEE